MMMSCYNIHTIDNITTVIYVCFSSIDATVSNIYPHNTGIITSANGSDRAGFYS